MADINSNKNAIIIQPITLQIRAPFQFLTNQRAIKHTHYSESRDGLNGRCSFSSVCGKGVHSWTQGLSSTRAVKVEQISPLFHLYLYLFFKSEEHPFFATGTWHAKYCADIYGSIGLWLRRRSRPFRFRRCFCSFISNIYTPEKGYYWQNQPNSLKVKGYQEVNSNVKQLLLH